MCGRFGIPGDHSAITSAFGIVDDASQHTSWTGLIPRYNIAPTDQVPVIFKKNKTLRVHAMRWGLIPFGAHMIKGRSVFDQSGKKINTPINARADTIRSKYSFKRSFEQRRCLIPVGGFYEWRKSNGESIPYWIYLKNRSWLGLAGLYNWWRSSTSQWMASCTIITTESNTFMEPIHQRMPVILTDESCDVWLDPENRDFSELQEVLTPCSSSDMQAHVVGRQVNDVTNDAPQLIEPVVS